MRTLLSSPGNMPLSSAENFIYQNVLKYVADIHLNLMAIKVVTRPEDFLGWCQELLRLCQQELNRALLEPAQLPIIKKFEEVLITGISVTQLKMLRLVPWPIFVDFITQQRAPHALDERFRLLDYITAIRATPLATLTEEDRLVVAGKHTATHVHSSYDFDVEWFASTKGAKLFHRLLQQQPDDFDAALSQIPLDGEVTFDHYQQFSQAYQKIFSSYRTEKPAGEKAPLAPATRLLAMRRPDQFIALTNAKLEIICQGFSIVKLNNFDLHGYWHELIGTLRTFSWWHQETPTDENELNLWRVRAILVDLFFFANQGLAENSNYLRSLDKTRLAENLPTISSGKKGKESIEEQVDRALAAEDIPPYLLDKRDSIIKEVKTGKSVEYVIKLMRAIFG